MNNILRFEVNPFSRCAILKRNDTDKNAIFFIDNETLIPGRLRSDKNNTIVDIVKIPEKYHDKKYHDISVAIDVDRIKLCSFIISNGKILVKYEKYINQLEKLGEITPAEKVKNNNRAYFSICSRNFLAHAIALYNSLSRSYENPEFYVALCDHYDEKEIESFKLPFKVIPLSSLGIQNIDEMSVRYNITEFNTSIKPFVFLYLIRNCGYSSVVYLDPDIFVVSAFLELDHLIDVEKADAVLTPHLTQPSIDIDIDVDEDSLLRYGIYNLGFLAIRATEQTINFLKWWAKKLETLCIIDLQKGIFVDQKWVDLLPAFVDNVKVLRHVGYNLAYWNLPQRHVKLADEVYFVNNTQHLRFVHFSGSKLDDLNVFSRHSKDITIDYIGDLNHLLNLYRREVYSSGHNLFRSIPYAFSWGGLHNQNEHTPKELDVSGDRSISNVVSDLGSIKSILYVDWSIPDPTKDAGSVTAYLMMKILASQGYSVDFLSASQSLDLKLVTLFNEISVNVVDTQGLSINDWLISNSDQYNVFILARGPVCSHFIDTINQVKRYDAITIFNTVDLHFVREERQGLLKNNKDLIEKSKETKLQEIKMLDNCDATIVLSDAEVSILQKFNSEKHISIIPLVFEDIPEAVNSYNKRNRLTFIGGFLHEPNVDCVIHLINDIWPSINNMFPDLILTIIGPNVPEIISKYSNQSNIEILGFVEDISIYFEESVASIAPLRFGAGIKGKIGTSMTFGVPCIASSIASEGMGLIPNVDFLLANTPDEYLNQVKKLLKSKALWSRLSKASVNFVKNNYSVQNMDDKISLLLHKCLKIKKDFYVYNFGEVININENFLKYTTGFSHPEEFGVWSIKKVSHINIHLKNYTNQNICVSFEIKGYIPKEQIIQTIDVVINGKLRDKINLTHANNERQFKTDLTLNDILKFNGNLIVNFVANGLYKPSDYINSSDSRTLAFHLSSFDIANL